MGDDWPPRPVWRKSPDRPAHYIPVDDDSKTGKLLCITLAYDPDELVVWSNIEICDCASAKSVFQSCLRKWFAVDVCIDGYIVV